MKVPKSLLGAILLGITLQALPSCKKEKESPDAKAKQEAKKKEEGKTNTDPCPACGMG
jgi:hypothetical protein